MKRATLAAAFLIAAAGSVGLVGPGPRVWYPPFGSEPGGSAQSIASGISRQGISSGGVVASPYSTLVYDTTQLFVTSRGVLRDDNGTMYGSDGNAPCTVGAFGCADATTDSIFTTTIRDMAAAGANKYERTSASADSLDLMFCRDSTSPFPACSNTAVGTCTSTIANARSVAGVLCAYSASTYGLCEPVGVTSVASCTASAANLMTVTSSPLQEGASRYQNALEDGVHGHTLYHKMLAQSIVNAPEELVYVPPVSLIANGGLIASATGWTDTSGGAANHTSLQDPQLSGAVPQINLRSAQSDAATDLITPPMTTVAGRTYVARGYVRQNHVSAETLTVTARAVDDDEVLTQKVYQVSGAVIQEWPSRVTTKDRQCFGSCMIIVKFVAVDTSTEILLDSNGASYVAADSWIAFPSETDNLALTPLLSKYSLAGIRIESDSRGLGASGLLAAFDEAFTLDVPRADLELEFRVTDVSTAIAGRRLDDVITQGYPTIDAAPRIPLTVVMLGVNDFTVASAATMATRVRQVTRRIRQNGSRPLWIAEPPYRPDTTIDYCSGGTNCGHAAGELIDTIQIAAPEELH